MKTFAVCILTVSLMAALTCGLTACQRQSGQTAVPKETSETQATVPSETAAQEENTPAETEGGSDMAGLANPWTEFQDMDEASEAAGFDFKIPALSNYVIRVIPGEMIEVTYPRNETEDIILRRSPNIGDSWDISGDYDNYPKNETLKVREVEVNIRKAGDIIYVAGFIADDGIYNMSSRDGITEKEIADILGDIIELNMK